MAMQFFSGIVVERGRTMSLFKNYVMTGLYFIERCAPDFDAWNQSMIHECGREVKEHLQDVRQWSLLISYMRKGPRPEKKNCWEFMACGKEVPCRHAAEGSVCPATLESRLDGMHGGLGAGRACWVVGGTQCNGQVQHSYERKRQACGSCKFYKAVRAEEGRFFLLSDELLLTRTQ
jgi:hypothetical protein